MAACGSPSPPAAEPKQAAAAAPAAPDPVADFILGRTPDASAAQRHSVAVRLSALRMGAGADWTAASREDQALLAAFYAGERGLTGRSDYEQAAVACLTRGGRALPTVQIQVLEARCAAALTPDAAWPRVRAQVRDVLGLWRELEQCRAHPDWGRFGLSLSGPCGGFRARAEALRESPELVRAMIGAGFDCTSVDVHDVAITAVTLSADPREAQYLNWMTDRITSCRAGLASVE
ncbi:MAG: hypothetical protein NW203_03655 [Hyphomonadaceae bacterium]|nr:hypothetical protein [Hyphomonadaceae bacterium]